MILTRLDQLEDYNKGDILYIVPTPQAEVCDAMYTFNLSAKLSVYYPINEIQKTLDFGIGYEQIDSGKKTSYLHEIDDIHNDLRNYDKLHIHQFIIGDNEREVLKAWEDSVHNFIETVKRVQKMAYRFKNDFDNAPFIIEHKEDFPEDWV